MALKKLIMNWFRLFQQWCLYSILVLTYFICSTVAANQQDVLLDQQRLVLQEFIQLVLSGNAAIAAQTSAWRATHSRIESDSSLDDPMLTYSFAPETQDSNNQEFGQKFQLSQKLPWPGKLGLREENARYKAQANLDSIGLLQLQLIVASTNVYADWFYIHEAQRINAVNQELWREIHSIAEVKYSSGRASKQDTLRAEVEQAMLEHQAIVLQRKQKNIQIRINTLLNRTPDKIVPAPTELLKVNQLPTVEQLRQLAINQHPELKILRAQQQASKVLIKLAERDYYPDFNLNAGYNSLWNQKNKRISIGIGINIPIGQAKRDARLGEKNALSLQLHWQIVDKIAKITGAVQRAYNFIEESIHVLSLYQNKLLPLAEENLQAAKADYQSARGSFLDLVSAEKNLIQTQLNQIQARSDYQRHLAKLAQRVGEPRLLEENYTITENTNSVVQGWLK